MRRKEGGGEFAVNVGVFNKSLNYKPAARTCIDSKVYDYNIDVVREILTPGNFEVTASPPKFVFL